MTLTIFVRYKGSAEMRMWPAGFENYRQRLWGSEHLKTLDVELLPQIATDVIVHGSEFVKLLKEVGVVESRVKASLASNSPTTEDRWWQQYGDELLNYCDNLRQAVAFAISEQADSIEIG